MLTQEDARRIARKLNMTLGQGRRHELAKFYYEGKLVVQFGISRSSKDQSHDYISKQLYISHRQTRDLRDCPLTPDQYVEILRSKSIITR